MADKKKSSLPEAISAGWTAAVNETLAEKLEGRLLAVYPGDTVTKTDTENGKPREVTLCMVWDITADDPVFMDHKAPFGWQVVRQQLQKSTPENPWIIGRLKQAGRAYILESPKVNEVQAITTKLQKIVAMIPELSLPDDDDDEAAAVALVEEKF